MPTIDRGKLSWLLDKERVAHLARTPLSRGGYPVSMASAQGNRIVDLDGNEYVDFALGDTAPLAR